MGGREGTVGKVPTIPKVDSGSVTIRDELAVLDTNQGKGIEIGSGVNERRANGKKAEVERPEVFEGRTDVPKRTGTDQGTVGEARPIKGNDQAADGGN